MANVQKSGKTQGAFNAEEVSAMQERAKEVRRGARADAGEAEAAVLAKIAELSESDRVLAERLHAVIKAAAPELVPSLWYGMPAYAKGGKGGKTICFFQPAQKFKTRYATLGFSADANLDEGAMWPTSYALTTLTADVEARIGQLVRKAIS